MNRIIRVGVLEDDPNMQVYLKAVLGVAEDIDLAFCVSTLAEAISVTQDNLDLCLIDLQLPDGNGTDFVAHLAKTSQAKALILTVLADKVSVMAAIRSGAHGYLLKDAEPHQILRHIKDTLKGETPVSGGTHAKSIYSKLGVNSRNEAIFEALKLGWIVV